ncbi:hypothetical protein Mnod_7481 [Methylobacterium nodulans ORS 2060]|uniref:Uncharacterized protein n=1 Tax=Methylobacterium nodulans (strain LMG 21967 / CNCM I-2342 / ORS 2060) TaxID=460265 RepID=B8IPC6_METNO|nr:hypothetical protein Mnod_7481 [Methylobacterium nodulans ORS 2060]
MRSVAERSAEIEGRVTFRGRGLAVVSGRRISLMVCPVCSQRNTCSANPSSRCNWCAYEPHLSDAEPVRQA